MKVNKGLHILGEFHKYQSGYGNSLQQIKTDISLAISTAGLTELGSYYHNFGKDAYTGVICLAESHISIHTWPESKYLTLDIYVCNFGQNNEEKAKKILAFFIDFYNPKEKNIQYIAR
ncbi:MAG: adenosylmethionine decarboxylase [Candidatus Gracilibacteria bacterium]|nr:adenosylmethionine decarboxylase [Candidatus Gracilibacteria bacterium]